MSARQYIIDNHEKVYYNSTENGKEFNLRDVIFIAEKYHKDQVKKLSLCGVINWVAVKDELPLVTGFYTVAKQTKPYVLGLYFDSEKQFRYDKQIHKNITHWQKLPEPPCL